VLVEAPAGGQGHRLPRKGQLLGGERVSFSFDLSRCHRTSLWLCFCFWGRRSAFCASIVPPLLSQLGPQLPPRQGLLPVGHTGLPHQPNGIDGPGGGHDHQHGGLRSRDGGSEEAVARGKIGGQGAVAVARAKAVVVVAALGRAVARLVVRAVERAVERVVSRTVAVASTTAAVATAAVVGSGGSGGGGGGGGDGG
jgi:hypothetical protein